MNTISMSIALSDIQAVEMPKQGTIRPCVEARLNLGANEPLLGIPVPPDQRLDYVRRKIIARLYADIAIDFDAYVALFTDPSDPDQAHQLREQIRAKLRGMGPGARLHAAPPLPD